VTARRDPHDVRPERRRRRPRRPTRGAVALRLTPMIDVVFLLLAYFLLAAEFREPEGAVAASAAPDPNKAEQTDPFALPREPVVVTVRSTGPGPADLALTASAPEIAHATAPGSLRRALAAARGPVFADDHPFIIRAAPDALWEHALAAAGAVDGAGYTAVTFERLP